MTIHIPVLLCALLAMQNPAPPPAAPAPGKQAAKPTVELLTPTPLDVTTTNGSSTTPFRLLITGAAKEIKTLDTTVPIGDGQALQGTVTARVESSAPHLEKQTVLVAVLIVKAAKPMPQNVKFSGLLIVPGVGHIPYSVTDKTNVVPTSSPDKIAVSWQLGEPGSVRLQVRNMGTSTFAINAAAVSLVDAGSKRRVEQDVTMTPTTQEIPSGQSRVLTVTMPLPPFAGTYAGTLSLRSETESFQVPVTLTTRGPVAFDRLWIPFVLFVLTVLAGIALSSKLERFFGEGGGMRRAETVVMLATLEDALERVRADLDAFAQARNLQLPGVLARFAPLRKAVRTARTVPNTPNIEALVTEARAAQDAGMLLIRLLEAGVPPLGGDAQALTELSHEVEMLPWPIDETSFQTFDTSLRASIDKVHKALVARATQAAALARQANQTPPAAPGDVVLPPGTPVTAGDAQKQITRMTYLQNAAIWLVSLLSAYQTFYAANIAFGTAVNYIVLFMWALGITQAGTQLLARARRPAN